MGNHTEPADGLAIAADTAEAAADMLSLDMLAAVADLVDPAAVAREMPWLAGELAKIATGRSDISFDERDQRFTDEAWRTVPYFRVLGQSYRLFEMWMNRMQESVDGSWKSKARARFAADVITAALSPTNYLGTNPAALRKAAETGGLSLVHGAQNMLRDLALLLSVDIQAWKLEAEHIPEHLQTFHRHLPARLWELHQELVERLG